jgi:hypothetical protein
MLSLEIMRFSDVGTDPGQFLGHDRLGHHVGPRPSELDGYAQSGKLELDARVKRFPRIGGVPIRFGGVGGDPILGEFTKGVPELAVSLGQREIGRVHPHKLLSGIRTTGEPTAMRVQEF